LAPQNHGVLLVNFEQLLEDNHAPGDMDRKRLLFACGLVAGTAYLSTSYDTSFAFDRPLHTIAVVFALSGLAIIAYARLAARHFSPAHKDRYDAIPLQNGAHSSRDSSPAGRPRGRPLSSISRIGLAILLLFAICIRIAIYHRVMKDIECAGETLMEWIPFVVAVSYVVRAWRNSEFSTPSKLGFSWEGLLHILFYAPSRYLLPAFLLSLSSCLAIFRRFNLRSTYICPQAIGTSAAIPRLQTLGFLVDCAIALVLYPLIQDGADENSSQRSNLLVALTLLISAAGVVVSGIYVYFSFPEQRDWMFSAPAGYIWSLFILSIAVPFTLVCFLNTARLYSVMGAVLTVSFTAAYMTIVGALNMGVSYTFPPKSTTELTVYLVLLSVALVLYVAPEAGVQTRTRSRFSIRLSKFNILITLLIFLSLFGLLGFWSNWGGGATSIHPITSLIQAANEEHEKWTRQAGSSKTLEDAVTRYRERHWRDPPPGFDKWYEYATSHSSMIIDDFDNIEDDLKPFWSISAAELRRRTALMLADEGAGLGGISIRNGKASVFANVPGTHRWMVDGAVKMIEKFAEFLPDMDLAMNLNDECRVAVPFDRVQEAIRHGQESEESSIDKHKVVGFSSDRAAGWTTLDDVHAQGSLFIPAVFKPSFQAFGSVACPSSSRARSDRMWDTRNLCTSCLAPHSMGALVANWSISSDPCHQPDLANLHGLHLSPSALVATHELVPIFSQSRAPGYLDIRYPSPWNYMDKTEYKFSEEFLDPAFVNKIDKLFWRGATSEGVSAGNGAWKGMLRQRIVNLVNSFDGPQAILLRGRRGRYRYVREEVGTMKHFLTTKTDIRFVGEIVRCGEPDCTDQAKEFKMADKIDFQQHWRYRYLFDADGAGFSGRFLPFLHSNSVVFKTALFREWYEGRLKAWKHFVPVDIRLHDLWSSLAYFGGYTGAGSMEGNVKEAQRISRESRIWAGNVLRKEDMEIYLFRLLLEYGRLTDDKRKEVGFRMGERA
jgi:hypothetical protein